MDFKARNPLFSAFPTKVLDMERFPFPFDNPIGYMLTEVDAPDHSAIFLRFGSQFSADESKAFSYLTETPPDCPMRKAFEYGDITWEDFWYSRDCLIQLEMPFPDLGPMVPARYIRPHEMDFRSKKYIEDVNHESPLMRHHYFLNNARIWARIKTEPQADLLERKYQDFILKYGQFLGKKAA